MFRVSALFICLLVSSAPCQSAAKYQVATIMEVQTHQTVGAGNSDIASYEVSLRVGDTT